MTIAETTQVPAHNAPRFPDDRERFEADAIPYMRSMYPAALRLTRNHSDAEDLIQETFARAYCAFDQFTPGTNLRAWLHCIMTRIFYSSCRKRRREPAQILASEVWETRGAGPLTVLPRSAEAEALDRLVDSAVMRALRELPECYKTVVYLADLEGYRYADIADLMGIPIGTVMSRIHRGRGLLRARLATGPTRQGRRGNARGRPPRGVTPRGVASGGVAQGGVGPRGVAPSGVAQGGVVPSKDRSPAPRREPAPAARAA